VRRRETIRDQVALELPDEHPTALGAGAFER